jgi:hypothetical protein
MLDRIAGQGIDINASGLDRAQQVDSRADKPLQSGNDITNGIIADNPEISAEAKARQARDAAVKPFVQRLQADGPGPLDASRVERFKQMVANGTINDYLNDVLPQAADALLASPQGKALKASLR